MNAFLYCLVLITGIQARVCFGQMHDEEQFGAIRGPRFRFPDLRMSEQMGPNMPHYLLSASVEPDYYWYRSNLIQRLLPSYRGKDTDKYAKGRTFLVKARPIYITRKPIIKIVKQPIFITQPIIIRKQPVFHKKEVVSVEKGEAEVQDVVVPEVSVKPPIKITSVGEHLGKMGGDEMQPAPIPPPVDERKQPEKVVNVKN